MPLYTRIRLDMLCSSFDNDMSKDLQKQRRQILQINHNIEQSFVSSYLLRGYLKRARKYDIEIYKGYSKLKKNPQRPI
jgi:hypothetical protein